MIIVRCPKCGHVFAAAAPPQGDVSSGLGRERQETVPAWYLCLHSSSSLVLGCFRP